MPPEQDPIRIAMERMQDDEKMYGTCGTVESFTSMSPREQEFCKKCDGPYTEGRCPLCDRAILISRHTRRMLASGVLAGYMCSHCLITAAVKLHARLKDS